MIAQHMSQNYLDKMATKRSSLRNLKHATTVIAQQEFAEISSIVSCFFSSIFNFWHGCHTPHARVFIKVHGIYPKRPLYSSVVPVKKFSWRERCTLFGHMAI